MSEQPDLTDGQRADLLARVRAGYDLEAAAADVGLDAVTALRDPALARDVPAAYAIGTSRLRARTLEFALSDEDASTLMRFIDKREAATLAALAEVQQPGSTVAEWLAENGLEPPDDKCATEWFVDLFLVARNFLRKEKEFAADYEPSVAERRRAEAILEAANHDIVCRSTKEQQKYARKILHAAGYTVVRYERPALAKRSAKEPTESVIEIESKTLAPPQSPLIEDDNHSLAGAMRRGHATLIGRS